jgi:hypothetical protein
VVEYLISKCKALSSNPSTEERKKERKGKKIACTQDFIRYTLAQGGENSRLTF